MKRLISYILVLYVLAVASLPVSCSSGAENYTVGAKVISQEEKGDWHYANVLSSAFDKIGFNLKESIMLATFDNGSTYWYFNVPQSVYKSWLLAPSIGKYFHSNVKGKYDYEKQ